MKNKHTRSKTQITAEREGAVRAMRAIAGYCRAEGYPSASWPTHDATSCGVANSIADAAAAMGQTPEKFYANFIIAVFYPEPE